MNDFTIELLHKLAQGTKFKLLIDESVTGKKTYPQCSKVSKYEDLNSLEFIKAGHDRFTAFNEMYDFANLKEIVSETNLELFSDVVFEVAVFKEIKKSDYILEAIKYFGAGTLIGALPLLLLVFVIFALVYLFSEKIEGREFWKENVVESEPCSKAALIVGCIVGVFIFMPIFLKYCGG